jgi:branched-subunit amino acid ABC-type transport system permease component
MQLFLAGAVAVFLGGVNRPIGWIIAAFVLALVQNLTPLLVEARWATSALYAAALAILIFRPDGIAGIRLRAERPDG